MDLDVALFVYYFFAGAFLLFLSVYFIITLSDLECDYINARQCCAKLNKFVVPEMVIHASMCIGFLFTWHYIMFLITLPTTAWNLKKALSIRPGSLGYYDPAEIHNRGQLKSYLKETMIKLGYHLVSFFILLYCMIVALVQQD